MRESFKTEQWKYDPYKLFKLLELAQICPVLAINFGQITIK